LACAEGAAEQLQQVELASAVEASTLPLGGLETDIQQRPKLTKILTFPAPQKLV